MSKNTIMEREYRHRLLGTASAIALTASLFASSGAYGADADRPLIWIEGGWHFETVGGKTAIFVPPYDSNITAIGFPSITALENTLGYNYGADGSISFRPQDSDWVFSASVRYGRAHGLRNIHRQKTYTGPQVAQMLTPGGKHLKNGVGNAALSTPHYTLYADQKVGDSESNTILDFAASKDVGLGLFGRGAESILGFGLRYAQLHAATGLDAHSLPDAKYRLAHASPTFHSKYLLYSTHHNSASVFDHESSFRGIGPALSWNNSIPFAGNIQDGELAFDWGLNASALFGRQRIKTQHQSTVRHFTGAYVNEKLLSELPNGNHRTNSRRITVPNAGAFAGISYRFTDAKLSLGYRVDYFFGALDGGIDTRRDITTSFNGPYASISIGIGD